MVVIKDRDIFFLTEPDGRVPLGTDHGFGLYYHDCRYLNGYVFTVGGKKLESLVANAESGYMAMLALTNPDMTLPDGTKVRKHNLGVKLRRIVNGADLALYDLFTFENLSSHPLRFEFALSFRTAFEDLFEVRNFPRERRGHVLEPVWQGDDLRFIYDGADDVYRSLTIHFSPSPVETQGTTALFRAELQPRESRQFLVSLLITESRNAEETRAVRRTRPNLERMEAALQEASARWLERDTQIFTDSMVLSRVLLRSLLDLNMLRSYVGREEYFAAGVPWFVALFGRDSIITALQTLAFNPPWIAEHTIRLLAGFQGKKVDEWREEEPGKILHEIRLGEMANLNEVPHTPYYGTIDATPLFLILVGRHAAWTGDISVFNELRGNVEAALEWISRYGDIDGDGYVEYIGNPGKGLLNQGWKDSGDVVVNSDGSLAVPPIALAEVQAYVYQAKIEIARLYRQASEPERAATLEREAEELRRRFNEDFWVDKGYY
ncbi:MAG TPA: glycogen debranching N-terminal domain-containing protein, partial [Blastocatellia bacterium]|nr:glycogen debranching N-terminal domain-containing protein [Blastocatellia bacterium]